MKRKYEREKQEIEEQCVRAIKEIVDENPSKRQRQVCSNQAPEEEEEKFVTVDEYHFNSRDIREEHRKRSHFC